MDREEFVKKCSDKLRMVRAEYGFSQDKMAKVLGISKKTIVEIEKGRSALGFCGSVALCTIFSSSEALSATFGGRATDIVLALAFDGQEPVYPQTMGGKMWWRDILQKGGYRVQQNIISQHYRILDAEDRRICSSFKFDGIKERFDSITA